jgi:hypothetical protein
MTPSSSTAGARLRTALEEEKPLQIVGAIKSLFQDKTRLEAMPVSDFMAALVKT